MFAGDDSGSLSASNTLFADGGMGAVPQRDADLLQLYTAYQRAATPADKTAALAVLDAEIDRRRAVDNGIRSAVWDLLQQPAVLTQLQVGVCRNLVLSCAAVASSWDRGYLEAGMKSGQIVDLWYHITDFYS